jgi:hypothetical protein
MSEDPVRKHVEQLLSDFLLNDRRIADRSDVEVKVQWGSALGTDPRLRGYAGMASSPKFPLQFAIHDQNRHAEVDFHFANGPTNRDQDDLTLLAFLMAYFGTSLALPRYLGQQMRTIRESLGLERIIVADAIKTPETILAQWESCRRSPKGSEMYRWCQSLGIVAQPHTALVRVVDFSPMLLRFLQEDPGRMRLLTPDQFERFVADRLHRMGYNVTLTGQTNRKDGGIDLIAVPKAASLGSFLIAAQMKHHRDDRRKTGRDAVDRLLAWKDHRFHIGLLVTNTGFTQDAVWTAQQERNAHFLRLRDFTDLKRWLEGRLGEEQDWREIPDRIELAPGIFIDVPRPQISVKSTSTRGLLKT